jgi:hypothetical protein
MRRDNVLRQLRSTLPLLLIPQGSADHIFKFVARRCEGPQILHREYLVEALLEGLDLYFDSLMEEIVHG